MKADLDRSFGTRQIPLDWQQSRRGAIVRTEVPAEGSRVRIDAVTAERDRPYIGVYGTLTQVDGAMGIFCVWLGLPFLHLVLATDVTVQS